MKHLIMIILAVFMLSGCTTTKVNPSLPFATVNRQGAYPVRKNVPVKNNTTWIYRQWGHQGR